VFKWLSRKSRTPISGNRLSEAVPRILSAYGELLTKYPSAIIDASWPPVDKKTMVTVFKMAWLGAKTDEARNRIEVCWALLPNFQEGVGETPITPQLPKDDLPSDESIAALEKFSLWGKLVVAEGNIMQRDRDEFKRAHSV
jgi:hypothetical protein